MTDKPTPEQIQRAGGITRDEARKVAEAIWAISAVGNKQRFLEAAATVIQQAFAERDGEDRMALQIIANPDWTWATVAEMREIARQALAAKGDSRG